MLEEIQAFGNNRIVVKKVLIYNYSLSVFLSRGKKDIFRKGTWFLFANELFFVSISLAMFIVTRFDFILSDLILFTIFLTIWAASFYGTRNWLINQLQNKKIEKEYDDTENQTHNVLMGLVLFVGSFIAFIVFGILTFEGYSI